jgi:soluble lytic murein transglycosylase-like protein
LKTIKRLELNHRQLQRALLSVTSLCLLAGSLAITPSALATAQEEPGSTVGMAPQSSVLDSNQIGPIAMMETSTSDSIGWSGPRVDGRTQQLQRKSRSIMGYIQARNKHLQPDEVNNFATAIVQFSGQYGVDYRLLTSIIAIESSFRRDAVSSSGAIGMGQLKPDTARWLGVSNPYDPVDNIAGTARFLAWLLHRYNGNLEYVVSAYYQGPGHVDRKGITPVCVPYLQKVNNALSGLL